LNDCSFKSGGVFSPLSFLKDTINEDIPSAVSTPKLLTRPCDRATLSSFPTSNASNVNAQLLVPSDAKNVSSVKQHTLLLD